METITIIIQERHDLRDPILEKKLRLNGFEATSYLDSVGAIIGNVSSDRIGFIEALDGVAWVEKNTLWYRDIQTKKKALYGPFLIQRHLLLFRSPFSPQVFWNIAEQLVRFRLDVIAFMVEQRVNHIPDTTVVLQTKIKLCDPQLLVRIIRQ